jgi:putative transposase
VRNRTSFLIHDRERIYSSEFDSALKAMDLSVLKTHLRAPQANAFCERLVGTFRRECLDYLIPLNERHLRGILKEWMADYNRGRPHSGPGTRDTRAGRRGEATLRIRDSERSSSSGRAHPESSAPRIST